MSLTHQIKLATDSGDTATTHNLTVVYNMMFRDVASSEAKMMEAAYKNARKYKEDPHWAKLRQLPGMNGNAKVLRYPENMFKDPRDIGANAGVTIMSTYLERQYSSKNWKIIFREMILGSALFKATNTGTTPIYYIQDYSILDKLLQIFPTMSPTEILRDVAGLTTNKQDGLYDVLLDIDRVNRTDKFRKEISFLFIAGRIGYHRSLQKMANRYSPEVSINHFELRPYPDGIHRLDLISGLHPAVIWIPY